MQCKRLIQINPDWFLLLRNISQMLVQFYLVDSEGVLVSKNHHKQATFCDPKLLVGKVTTCSQTAAISLVEGVECSFAAKHVGINHIFQTSHSRVSELYKQESCNHRNQKCTLNYHPQFTCRDSRKKTFFEKIQPIGQIDRIIVASEIKSGPGVCWGDWS